MAPLKDGSCSASMRPKAARFSDVQPLRSPPTDRRSTFASSKSHTAATPSSKPKRTSGGIEKLGSHRKTAPDETSIAEQFADRLDDHRIQIQTDVDNDLSEIRTEHVTRVESLSAQFEKQLSILCEAEGPLRSPLAAEVIRIEGAKSGEFHGREYIDVGLEERITEFQKLVKEKHLAISKLIDEWNEIQVQIIALAAEIQGPDRVVIEKDRNHKEHFDFEKIFKQSKVTHDKSEKDFESLLQELSGLEQKTTQLTQSTKETMRKQQQERVITQQRHLKEISRLAKEMECDED